LKTQLQPSIWNPIEADRNIEATLKVYITIDTNTIPKVSDRDEIIINIQFERALLERDQAEYSTRGTDRGNYEKQEQSRA